MADDPREGWVARTAEHVADATAHVFLGDRAEIVRHDIERFGKRFLDDIAHADTADQVIEAFLDYDKRCLRSARAAGLSPARRALIEASNLIEMPLRATARLAVIVMIALD